VRSAHSPRSNRKIPEILLSDLNMPGMSGFELLSAVRRRFSAIQVIAMSERFQVTVYHSELRPTPSMKKEPVWVRCYCS
jgi:CheY-like chemotaxis protein